MPTKTEQGFAATKRLMAALGMMQPKSRPWSHEMPALTLAGPVNVPLDFGRFKAQAGKRIEQQQIILVGCKLRYRVLVGNGVGGVVPKRFV